MCDSVHLQCVWPHPSWPQLSGPALSHMLPHALSVWPTAASAQPWASAAPENVTAPNVHTYTQEA